VELRETNWAGNHTYQARRLVEPRSIEELQEVVRTARALRILGSRHSFNDIADTDGGLISLGALPTEIRIDHAAQAVSVEGRVRYGELAVALEAEGMALPNLASLPHISVAGACATGTHGSGDGNGCLATSVVAVELVRADGEIERLAAAGSEEPLAGAAVSLGALGVVTRMTLAIEPRFDVSQVVYQDIPLARYLERFDEITSSAYSVSAFTDWSGPSFHQLWLKSRNDGAEDPPPPERFGGRLAEVDVHPIPGYPADSCTEQRGAPGPWHQRLPHFRLDHSPSAGDELQTEYMLDRRHLGAAFEALAGLRTRIAPLCFSSEVRTIAADDLWLSPCHGRPSVALHFTWEQDWPAVRELLPAIEGALDPFEPRPHWGKLFTMAPEVVASRYPHREAFVELANRLDPNGTFRNEFVDRLVFGGLGGDIPR
jgi:xylitol oxidase